MSFHTEHFLLHGLGKGSFSRFSIYVAQEGCDIRIDILITTLTI